MSDTMTTPEATTRKRGRPAGKKNLPIPEAWQPMVGKCGGVTKTAEACGVSYVTLRRWFDGGTVHEAHLPVIRQAALAADVASPV